MKALLIEPFYGGSHKQWADDLVKYSAHQIQLLTLSGHHWKWRMQEGAISLAAKFNKSDYKPDVILATDMLDLPTFLAFTGDGLSGTKKILYFHENQLTYPWSEKDRDKKRGRDNHYAFINFKSALIADKCLFNSAFHLNSFLQALPVFLKQFPDRNNLISVEKIAQKSEVLHLGLDLKTLDAGRDGKEEKQKRALILWNHRWEYDKNPESFFTTLFKLKERGIEFKLAVLGEELDKCPEIFDEAKKKLAAEIVHWGFVKSKKAYAKWLWRADILPVTSIQDFFGGSIIEAVYCNTIPLLPRRLAYPEHFTEDWQQRQFFYENDEDLLNKLQRFCMDVSVLRKQSTSKFVSKYDWTDMINIYDEQMIKLMDE